MDVVVTGRHIQLGDRFRQHVLDRMGKVEQLAPRTVRVDVLVTHEPNHRQAKSTERVEITCHARGPVIRAEASHDDKYAAFEMAMDRLVERLRRVADKRRVSRGRRTPESVAEHTGRLAQPAGDSLAEVDLAPDDGNGAFGDSPIEVREKIHSSAPMSLSDALYQMEMVGHDFFLFHDVDTDKPSVVYRRRGWSYGVIHLEVADAETAAS